MLNFIKQKELKLITAVVLAVVSVCFIKIDYVLAAASVSGTVNDVLLGTIGYPVTLVIGFIALIITSVIGVLITVAVAVLVQVAQFNNIINVPTVVTGWVIIRDLCNMFFIVILLVIAFATILRQENYSAKKILPKLLIMAVLINFSRTIFGLLIDASQIVMLTFVNAFAAGGGWFIEAFQTNFLLSMNTGSGYGSGEFAASAWATTVAIIAGVLAAIITLIVLVVMLAVLVWRIVILWIYTIFSPVVFLGFAFPPLQKYTSKIWEDFTKQLVVGPVLAFFIWLALSTASTSTKALLGDQSMNGPQVCAGIGKFFCQGNLQQFIIVIGLLMGGLMVAQEMGGVAGKIAGKGLDWAKKVASSPGLLALKGTKRFGTYMEMKAQEWHMPIFNRGWWQGLSKKGDDERKRAIRLAGGKGEQIIEDYWHPKGLLGRKRKGARDMYERARMEVVNEYVSENRKAMGAAANPRQELVNISKRAAEAEGADGDFQREAAVISSAAQGNFDDVTGALMANFVRRVDKTILNDADFEKKYKMSKKEASGEAMTEQDFKGKFGVTVKEITLKNGKINMDAHLQGRFMAGYLNLNQAWMDAGEIDKNWRNMSQKEKEADRDKKRAAIKVLLKKTNSTEQNKVRAMAVASEAGKEIGHWEQLFAVKDNETGYYKILTELDRLDEIRGEMAKRPTREIIQRTATHVFRPSEIEPATGEFDRSANMDNMGFFETETSKNLWKGQVLGDIHQSPTRTSEHLYGVYFDDKGALITDPEVCKKLGFVDVNGDGSPEKLKESQERAKELNHQIINALYKNKYYGRKDGAPYGETGWRPIP